MTTGMLQLTENTPGGDCLEISLDEENTQKLQSKVRPVALRGTITRQAPLHQTGVEPSPPTYFRIFSNGHWPKGIVVSRLITPAPYQMDSVVEFEII